MALRTTYYQTPVSGLGELGAALAVDTSIGRPPLPTAPAPSGVGIGTYLLAAGGGALFLGPVGAVAAIVATALASAATGRRAVPTAAQAGAAAVGKTREQLAAERQALIDGAVAEAQTAALQKFTARISASEIRARYLRAQQAASKADSAITGVAKTIVATAGAVTAKWLDDALQPGLPFLKAPGELAILFGGNAVDAQSRAIISNPIGFAVGAAVATVDLLIDEVPHLFDGSPFSQLTPHQQMLYSTYVADPATGGVDINALIAAGVLGAGEGRKTIGTGFNTRIVGGSYGRATAQDYDENAGDAFDAAAMRNAILLVQSRGN